MGQLAQQGTARSLATMPTISCAGAKHRDRRRVLHVPARRANACADEVSLEFSRDNQPYQCRKHGQRHDKVDQVSVFPKLETTPGNAQQPWNENPSLNILAKDIHAMDHRALLHSVMLQG